MKTNAIRKRHELFISGSQVKYIVLTVLAVVVIVTVVAIVALLFKGIVS
ncbi:MAG: hypothetical protein HY015_05955 [Bacteroidetes bacterium]|nr:hypothetical protein [Bacteroidota bacterium]